MIFFLTKFCIVHSSWNWYNYSLYSIRATAKSLLSWFINHLTTMDGWNNEDWNKIWIVMAKFEEEQITMKNKLATVKAVLKAAKN